MSEEKKGIGSKLLGIFVESGGASPPEGEPGADEISSDDAELSPAEQVARLAGQSRKAAGGAQPPTPELKVSAPAQPGGPVDFQALFKEVMSAEDLDRVTKAEELVKSLPDGTPQPVKKQIVETSLKVFGFEVSKIVQAVQLQKSALDAYVRASQVKTAESTAAATAEIKTLQEKIAQLQASIEKRTQGHQTLASTVEERKVGVQKVLDFFQS
jgi:hypothetical protein